MSTEGKKQRAIRGRVTSDKMDKSRVLTVERRVKNPTVGKYVKRSTKFMFHDDKNESKVGDWVLITPTRPMSARKSFKLLSIISQATE